MLIQAGSSEAGKSFAAKVADAVFTGQANRSDAVMFSKDVKGRAAAAGRDPAEVLVLPGCSPIVGRTAAEAEAKYREIADLVVMNDALNYLGRFFNDIDFTQFELDAPFPDLGDFGRNGWESTTDHIKQAAREEGLTLRDVALRSTTPRHEFIGTPSPSGGQNAGVVRVGRGRRLHAQRLGATRRFHRLHRPCPAHT